MNYQQLIEDLVGLVPPGSKYVWYDADTLIYLAALRACKMDIPIEAVEDLISHMYARFEIEIRSVLGHDIVIIHCLSTRKTFRHEVCETYKSNRKDKWKPPLLTHCADVYQSKFPCIKWDNHEADDIVSILHHQIPGHYLASGDKDLLQCPGVLYNPRTVSSLDISHKDALYHRCYQWLTGDSADGYSGAYLIGDAKARKILDPLFETDDVDIQLVVDTILSIYETRNESAKDKGYDDKIADPIQQFHMSQMLLERLDNVESLSDPVPFLQALQDQGSNTTVAVPQ